MVNDFINIDSNIHSSISNSFVNTLATERWGTIIRRRGLKIRLIWIATQQKLNPPETKGEIIS